MKKPQLNPKKRDFNWLTALQWLTKNKPTSYWKGKLIDTAGEWPTCACGQVCKKLPKRMDTGPRDQQLYSLGLRFYDYVETGQWGDALRCFKQIERRTTKLLKKL